MSVWTTAGLIADGTFDDPANARVIYLAVAGLVLLAVLLGVGTWLWWRSSKVENPVLAPLEVMSTRRWWKSDFNERQRRLEAVRPTVDDIDADTQLAAGGVAPVAEPVDLDHVLVRDDPHTFDDLVDPDAVAEAGDVSPAVDPPEVAQAIEVADIPASADAASVVAVSADSVSADSVAAAEPSAVAEPPAEPAAEPAAAPAAELAAEPAAEFVMRSIVIDTAPKPRDTPADLGPEAAESDPTPAPIDPLLRLQAE